MNRFNIVDLPLGGLKLVERRRLGDARGFLSRLFCIEELSGVGWCGPIAQINHTYTSQRGTVRGMHFQLPPKAEMKLVSCLRGTVWDAVVDVRAESASFLRWHAEQLSAENGRSMLIPEGFAHGFQALTDNVELLYCHTAVYSSELEAGLNPKDPRLAIGWPLPFTQISERDSLRPMLDDRFSGIVL